MLGMLLASMLSSDVVRAAVPADECEAAVAQAEVAVAHARNREALWTTAVTALREARRLRRAADWSGCDASAREARLLSELGLKQLDYPPERN
jgi:hypothetical protein